MEEMSYVFSFTFFSLHFFFLALVTASISHFVTSPTNFHIVLPTKKCVLCFLSLALDLSLSLAGLPLFLFFSVLLLLYITNL